MKSVIVEINPEGEIKIETVGYKGNACTQATVAMEKALGSVTSRKHKPEFYATGTVQQKAGAS
jgi:Protein of unknown function (DUF2997)